MIKYKYAYNSHKKIICIDEVSRENSDNNEKYNCISCSNELIPRIGKQNKRHFAHKVTIECNGQTYLHKLGKELFEKHYNNCVENHIPFWLKLNQQKYCNCLDTEFNRKCYLGMELVEIDLTKYYKKIAVEQIEGEFIPDLKLTHNDPKNQIFIEIAVTHRSTEKKLDSDIRILELKVDEESDLDVIKQHEISEDNPKIKIINFNRTEINEIKTAANCDKEAELFIVYKSGKCFIKTLPINKIQSERSRLRYSTIFSSIKSQFFENHVIDAYRQNLISKNCYLCANHAKAKPSWDILDQIDNMGKAIYCYKNKTRCNSNDAIECIDFRFSEKKMNEYSFKKITHN